MPHLIPLPGDPIIIEQAEPILGHYGGDADKLAADISSGGKALAKG
jgi:hypothetical protein